MFPLEDFKAASHIYHHISSVFGMHEDELTLLWRGLILLVQHKLLHLLPQVLLVKVARIKGITHEFRHSRAGGNLFFILW